MGWRSCQVGSVGQAFFFFSLVAKMTLKTFLKKIFNLTFFAKEFWENILTFFFKKIQLKFLDLVKKWLILQDFGKIKKKISAKMKNLGRSCQQNGFTFFLRVGSIGPCLKITTHECMLVSPDECVARLCWSPVYLVFPRNSAIFIPAWGSNWDLRVSLKGIHHYYTLHRLSVQIEVPSRGCISKKSWFAYIDLVWFFSDECFLQHI